MRVERMLARAATASSFSAAGLRVCMQAWGAAAGGTLTRGVSSSSDGVAVPSNSDRVTGTGEAPVPSSTGHDDVALFSWGRGERCAALPIHNPFPRAPTCLPPGQLAALG
jgi:hypothetical protein